VEIFFVPGTDNTGGQWLLVSQKIKKPTPNEIFNTILFNHYEGKVMS
jgi:hypothetical protein